MAYSNFDADAVVVARTLHLAYPRSKFLLDRWYNGANTEHPNEGAGIPVNNLMNRVAELVSDYEANSNAKLGTVLTMSDLTLPGDA